METLALVMFIAGLVSVQVHGLAVKELSPLDGTISKEIKFESGRGRSRSSSSGEESITISGKEARFDVLSVKNGIKMVLDYGNEKIVFTHPKYNDRCFIDVFDKELQESVPLEKIRTLLKESKGTMAYPTVRYRIEAKTFEKTKDSDLSPLSKDLCKNLTPYKVIRKESTKALAVREPVRRKREVGWQEVILIVVVCILIL